MGVSLLAIVNVRLTADWTNHVTHVAFTNHDLKVML